MKYIESCQTWYDGCQQNWEGASEAGPRFGSVSPSLSPHVLSVLTISCWSHDQNHLNSNKNCDDDKYAGYFKEENKLVSALGWTNVMQHCPETILKGQYVTI